MRTWVLMADGEGQARASLLQSQQLVSLGNRYTAGRLPEPPPAP